MCNWKSDDSICLVITSLEGEVTFMKLFNRNKEVKNKDIDENDNPDRKVVNSIIETPDKVTKEPLDTSSNSKNSLFEKVREAPSPSNESVKLKKPESEVLDKSLDEQPDKNAKKKNDFFDSIKVSTPTNSNMEKLKKPEGDNNTDGDPNIGSLEKEKAHTCDMDMDDR